MINFKNIILSELLSEEIFIVEGPSVGDISSPACCLFSFQASSGTAPLIGYDEFDQSDVAKSYILAQRINEYNAKFGMEGGYPNEMDMKTLCSLVNSGPVSRGGVAQYKNYAHYLPIIDLMFIVVQENALTNTGDFFAGNKCIKANFGSSSLYRAWFDALKNVPPDSLPIDWVPLSTRGNDVKRGISDDILREYAAKLALASFVDRSILFTITNLLEARKEMRFRTTIKKTKAESSLHPDVIKLLTEPEKFSGATQKLPAKVNNMYDSGNSSSISQQIWDLGLIIKQFFEAELSVYFSDENRDSCITTVKDVLLNNNVQQGSSPESEGSPATTGNFFYFKDTERNQIPSNRVGDGGYILKNIQKYKGNPHSATLYNKIKELAEYIKQGKMDWQEVLGGARKSIGAISSLGGKFGT